MERLLHAGAGVSAILALFVVALAVTGRPGALWLALALVYTTGVGYGLAEMRRLYETHRRRCRECLEGTGRHLRWWLPRVLLVLIVSLLPVLLLLPLAGDATR